MPQTYLKHFLHNDSLFMYKKGEKFFDKKIKPEDRIFKVNTEAGLRNIGVERHLYDPKIDGISSDDLENIFEELGEGSYDATIAAIRTLPYGSSIPANIKSSLCPLMASLRVRTPLFKKEIEEIGEETRKHLMAARYERMSLEDVAKHAKEALGKEITVESASKIRNSFVSKKHTLKYPNAYFIRHALLRIEEYVNIFQQMTMVIYKSHSRFFMTNDNPVVYFVPQKNVDAYNPPKGLVAQYCEVFFPLTKDLAIHLTWRNKGENLLPANREIINAFNENLSHNSLDYIFSPMKVEELEKFTQKYIPYPFKLVIR